MAYQLMYQVFYTKRLDAPYAVPPSVNGENYKPIGIVAADDLEHLFRVMNVVDGSSFEMPQKLRCRSMCVGDVAVDETGQAWYCASAGWERVDRVGFQW